MPHRPQTTTRQVFAAIAALGVLAVPACSDETTADADPTTTSAGEAPASTTSTAPRPEARSGRADTPAAAFTSIEGGAGPFLISASSGPDLAAAGYGEAEYSASGSAVRYSSAGDAPDGRMELTAGDAADYRTRVLVRRPENAADFNGTLVVEWLNVSSGADVAPDYTYLAEELVREGYAWAGVSAQRIGIEGGAVAVPVDVGIDTGAGKGIKSIDPERYGDLSHPGDAFAYDIFTQVSRGLRTTGDGAPLSGLDVRTTLAVGESQSAFALTTYADGVQPLSQEFDGFLIHSRGGAAMPLGEPGTGVDITGTVFGTPTRIRTDLDVPVLVVQTESDVTGVLAYLPARQEDTDAIRIWELAGTAHADRFQIGAAEAAIGCTTAINDGQQVFVLRAGLRALATWSAGGAPPPSASPLDVVPGTPPTYATDDRGNATGGVRTPAVDAATQILSGDPSPGGGLACTLMGRTEPLAADVLASAYPTPGAYTAAYEAATDAGIEAGFLLEDDRAAIIADARPGGQRQG